LVFHLVQSSTSRVMMVIRRTARLKPYPIFQEFPAPPTLIPRTMLIAAKKSASLPTQWWYQFQNLRYLESFLGLRKIARI
jgi:hypothetical protein